MLHFLFLSAAASFATTTTTTTFIYTTKTVLHILILSGSSQNLLHSRGRATWVHGHAHEPEIGLCMWQCRSRRLSLSQLYFPP